MISLRYTPSQRLKNSAEFKHVLSDAKRFSSPCLNVFCRANQLEYPRLGLSISKRSFKRAVDRNWVKRQVRETFRLHQAEIGSIDVIFIMRHCQPKPEKQEIKQCIEQLWQKLVQSFGSH